jgi:F420-dependent oxidoreductase-like protein
VKISTQLMYAGNPRDAADQVVALEQAGLDTIWVPEAYGFDSPTLMGYLAAKTETVEIGSAILNVYSRTPSALLQTAAGLDNVSQGRAIIGLGASGPQVIEGFHGVPFDAPVGRVTEIIDICRTVWRREPLVHEGRSYQIPLPEGRGTGLGKPLKMIDHPVRDRIPIFVAGTGPRNVENAARIADGWIPIFFWPERAAQVWNAPLAAGLAQRDPALAPLEVSASVTVAIGDDVEHLREKARPQLALYIGGMGARSRNFYNDLACRYGLEGPAAKIQDLYLAGHKDEAARAVPDELIEGTTLIGPAGYVRERLAAYREAGVTLLTVRPAGPDPDPQRLLGQLRDWI